MATRRPLSEQVIVIPGASSGIGLATALRAAGQGARGALVARSSQVLQALELTMADHGGQALAVAADVSDREERQAALTQILARLGRIDAWVDNAGVAIHGALDEVEESDRRRLLFEGQRQHHHVALAPAAGRPAVRHPRPHPAAHQPARESRGTLYEAGDCGRVHGPAA